MVPETNPMEETLICSQENVNRSLSFLNDSFTWEKLPKMLTFDCFIMLKEDSKNVESNWSHAVPISKEELHAQVHYDLGCYFFYKENYMLATRHFMQSKICFKDLKQTAGFVDIEVEDLDGYISACSSQAGEIQKSLLHQMRASITNQYTVSYNVRHMGYRN